MIVIGIEDPKGQITYAVAALPSQCGKTNLAMLQSALPGYKIWTLGDDIAWLNIGPDGRLYAINPETGFFGVAYGTGEKTNPNMIKTLKTDKFFPTLYTNVGLDVDKNEPWWEGFTDEKPKNLLDWQRNKYDHSSKADAAHKNSRFTVSITQCPNTSKEFYNPKGVPISAIIFGGRRSKLIPLVYESLNWQNGVFLGSIMGSETTAALIGQQGVLRRDPMAMQGLCGYNMALYFKHWLNIGKKSSKLPKIFFVNWFRTDENGKFIWPGFGDNIRAIKWIIDRVHGKVEAKQTWIGMLPFIKDFDRTGLNIPEAKLKQLFEVNIKDWGGEIEDIKKHYAAFGDKIPQELITECNNLIKEYEKAK
jgi:phosphoenolpyruvate carboxykinase (GTP)